MQRQLNKRRGAGWTYVALAGLAAAWAASSAECQMVQAGQDTRTGTILANDFVGGSSTAGYAIGPSTLYDPVDYSQVVADGAATASLITDSHWINQGPMNVTDGFTVTGQCYADLGIGFGTATSSDHLEIGLVVSGLPSGGSIPFRFSGALVNIFSSASVSITGPGLLLVLPQGLNNWDFDVFFYNDGAYTLTIDMSSSLTNVQGPDLGRINYNVTLKRKTVVPNDLCENATPVEVGTYPVTNVYATGSTALPAGCGSAGLADIIGDVFYTYVAPVTGVATVSTCNASDFDSWLAAYTGPCGAPNFVACSDDGDGCGLSAGSLMSFPTTAGETYTIVFGGWGGATGDADMTISQAEISDTCADPIPISVGTTPFSTISATGLTELPEGCWSFGEPVIDNEIFFVYQAPSTGEATVSLCDAVDYDSFIAAFTGSCDAPTFVACNDDSCGMTSLMSFPTTRGESYTIVVGGWGGSTGSGTITISQTVANDTCAGATPISAGVTPTSTIGATGDSVLPAGCEEGYGLDVFNDVFFTYEATATGVVTVATCSPNTTFDTRLAVYSGSCDDLTLIACNDDTGSECGIFSIATFQATCGERYIIQLGSYDGGAGLADLAVSQTGTCAAPCPADLNGNGLVGAEDLGILLGQWGASGNADLNGNGVVDAGDLGILLGTWGGCD
ncbi:MAG: hypothetical protein U0575_09405 [Phycisphaerales bacterium]